MSAISVSVLPPEGDAEWDRFVHAASDGTFFHLAGWRRVIARAFGHRTFFLCARRGKAIVGVLPLTQVKTWLFGNALISSAFCVQGGILAQDDDVRDALRNEAVRIAKEQKVGHIELRSVTSGDPSWVRKENLYVDFRRDMSPDVEANMKAIPRKQRAMVRKGISNGLQSELDKDASRLHHVYAESVRNLGTPVFPLRYFQALIDEFGEHCDIVTIVKDQTPVASVMNFYFRDQVLPYYGGGTQAARELAANDFMYWEVMRRACERGFRVFDFGRSKVGTGAFHFKRNWGFEPTPLAYEVLPIGRSEIPEVNPTNPKYRAIIALWQRLPLPLTKFIGPFIVRGIG